MRPLPKHIDTGVRNHDKSSEVLLIVATVVLLGLVVLSLVR